jgi:hypothetical protein
VLGLRQIGKVRLVVRERRMPFGATYTSPQRLPGKCGTRQPSDSVGVLGLCKPAAAGPFADALVDS